MLKISEEMNSDGNMMEKWDLSPRIASSKAEVGTHKVQGPAVNDNIKVDFPKLQCSYVSPPPGMCGPTNILHRPVESALECSPRSRSTW
jgi:hypothetical protein